MNKNLVALENVLYARAEVKAIQVRIIFIYCQQISTGFKPKNHSNP